MAALIITCRRNGKREQDSGFRAIVADDSYTEEVLRSKRWHRMPNGYAATAIDLPNGKRTKKMLHQFVFEHYFGTVPAGLEIDHKDRNKLNCQPENLRAVTRAVNELNKPARCTSGLKNVYHVSRNLGRDHYWRVGLFRNGRNVKSKYFPFTSDGKLAAAEFAARFTQQEVDHR